MSVRRSPLPLPPPQFPSISPTTSTTLTRSPSTVATPHTAEATRHNKSIHDTHLLPSRLPFSCSSVQLRGGPLLQPVDVACNRIYLDLNRAQITMQLKWTQIDPINPIAPHRHTPEQQHAPHAPFESSLDRSFHTPPGSRSIRTIHSPTPSKKRMRDSPEEADQEEQQQQIEETTRVDTNTDNNTLFIQSPIDTSLAPPFTFTPLSSSHPMSADLTSTKRTRLTDSHRPFFSNSSPTPIPSPAAPSSSHKTIFTIPLSSVVGVDFSISLDSPATCTFALKPAAVYTNEEHNTNTNEEGRAHRRRRSALEKLPVYSPARIIASSYQSAAAIHPARFDRCARFIQRVLPPLLYWVWLHSTYLACSFLFLGLILSSFRFWASGMTCIILYFALLIGEFRRSQADFKTRLMQDRQPMDECLYVHLVFAHDSYPSFLSFRRLFVAAAPAFSAPSASSTEPSVFINPELPGALRWGRQPSTMTARYSIATLQHVLPTSPIFFNSVYVDFICYLLLSPRIFASARVRSLTHYLLPVLYLGQAMVAAVGAFTPIAVQGYAYLAPYMLVELHWFLSVLNSLPNPLSYLLDFLLPLRWIRDVIGVWIVDIAAFSLSSWTAILAWAYTLSAPIRWANAIISPVLEVIRQEMRALWGLSVLFQPVVTVLIRIQSEALRLWSGLTSFASLLAVALSGLLPSRLFSLFVAFRSGARATAAVGSGISASGGLTRWRSMYQSTLEFFTLLGKWKVVIDRLRLNIQLWYYERFVHVKDARNLNPDSIGPLTNTNLDVPLVRHMQRTQSEQNENETQEEQDTNDDQHKDGGLINVTPIRSSEAIINTPTLNENDGSMVPPIGTNRRRRINLNQQLQPTHQTHGQ